MKNKTLFNSLIFTFSLIGSCLVLDKPIKAGLCPDPSTVDGGITGIGTFAKTDPKSFWSLTGEGYCTTTPEQYGVKVFKMGFCKENPGNTSGSAPLEGDTPVYSSCSWGFESTDGIDASFTAISSIDLPEANSSTPAAGTYSYAVMIISNDIKIKGKYGPVGGDIYYSKDANASDVYAATTNINEYAPATAPLDSFSGPTECTASSEGKAVTGGTMSGYLLASNGDILVSDEVEGASDAINPCSGVDKLLGVVRLTNDLTIDDATNGLEMTFGVTNAMNVTLDRDNGLIEFISQAFNVTFETF